MQQALPASEWYPDLSYLVQTRFDQDRDIASSDPDERVAAFRDEESVATVLGAARDACAFAVKFGTDDLELGRAMEAAFAPAISFYNWKSRTSYDGLMQVVRIPVTKRVL